MHVYIITTGKLSSDGAYVQTTRFMTLRFIGRNFVGNLFVYTPRLVNNEYTMTRRSLRHGILAKPRVAMNRWERAAFQRNGVNEKTADGRFVGEINATPVLSLSKC